MARSTWILTDAILLVSTSSDSESWDFPFKKGGIFNLIPRSRPVCHSHDRPSLNPLIVIGPLFRCSESILYLKLILHTTWIQK